MGFHQLQTKNHAGDLAPKWEDLAGKIIGAPRLIGEAPASELYLYAWEDSQNKKEWRLEETRLIYRAPELQTSLLLPIKTSVYWVQAENPFYRLVRKMGSKVTIAKR